MTTQAWRTAPSWSPRSRGWRSSGGPSGRCRRQAEKCQWLLSSTLNTPAEQTEEPLRDKNRVADCCHRTLSLNTSCLICAQWARGSTSILMVLLLPVRNPHRFCFSRASPLVSGSSSAPCTSAPGAPGCPLPASAPASPRPPGSLSLPSSPSPPPPSAPRTGSQSLLEPPSQSSAEQYF